MNLKSTELGQRGEVAQFAAWYARYHGSAYDRVCRITIRKGESQPSKSEVEAFCNQAENKVQGSFSFDGTVVWLEPGQPFRV